MTCQSGLWLANLHKFCIISGKIKPKIKFIGMWVQFFFVLDSSSCHNKHSSSYECFCFLPIFFVESSLNFSLMFSLFWFPSSLLSISFKLNKIVIRSYFSLFSKFSKRVYASFLYSTKGSLCPKDLKPMTCLNCSKYWICSFQFWSINCKKILFSISLYCSLFNNFILSSLEFLNLLFILSFGSIGFYLCTNIIFVWIFLYFFHSFCMCRFILYLVCVYETNTRQSFFVQKVNILKKD